MIKSINRKVALFLIITTVFSAQTGISFAAGEKVRETGSKKSIVEAGAEVEDPREDESITYDANGRLIKRDVKTYVYLYKDGGKTLAKTINTYEEYGYRNGKKHSETTKDSLGFVRRNIYIYKGKKLKKVNAYIQHKKTGRFIKKSVITYKRGKLKLVQYKRSPKGKLQNKTVTKYNSKHKKISVKTYIGSYVDHYKTFKYYKNGSIKETVEGDEYGCDILTYDKNGLLVKSVCRNYDEGAEDIVTTYEYSDFFEGDPRYPQEVKVISAAGLLSYSRVRKTYEKY